jgi:hypothetical protein
LVVVLECRERGERLMRESGSGYASKDAATEAIDESLRGDGYGTVIDREQAAAILKCSIHTISRRIRSSQIQAIRAATAGSARVYLTRRSVAAYLAGLVAGNGGRSQ